MNKVTCQAVIYETPNWRYENWASVKKVTERVSFGGKFAVHVGRQTISGAKWTELENDDVRCRVSFNYAEIGTTARQRFVYLQRFLSSLTFFTSLENKTFSLSKGNVESLRVDEEVDIMGLFCSVWMCHINY